MGSQVPRRSRGAHPKVDRSFASAAGNAAASRAHFEAGGFNARPMKTPGGYRLATLSDHALGIAIDIDTRRNAQIETRDLA